MLKKIGPVQWDTKFLFLLMLKAKLKNVINYMSRKGECHDKNQAVNA